MQQKAYTDFEIEDQTAPARRVFGKILFVLAFMFLMTSLFWLASPKVALLELQLMDEGDKIRYNSDNAPCYIYTEQTDEKMALAEYDEWHAKHDKAMALQCEPVWVGYITLGGFVLCLALSMLLSIRTRSAFKSSTPAKTVGRFAFFIIIILIMLGLSSLLPIISAESAGYTSVPTWFPLGFGALFGFIIGLAWWIQAKLSGCFVNSGYRYDAGFIAGGERKRQPTVYQVEAGEYIGEIDISSRPRYPVEDLSAWTEEDRTQYAYAVADTARQGWIGYQVLS